MDDILLEDTGEEVVKPRRKRRAPAVASGESGQIERIKSGEWRSVLDEVGSTEYNRLRLLALK